MQMSTQCSMKRLLSEHEKLVRLRALIAIGTEQAERGDVVEYNQAFRDDAKRSTLRHFAAGEKPQSSFLTFQ